MIAVEQVSKTFGSQPTLDQVSTCFKKGQVTSIIGPNGAGKSTLLSIVSRLLEKDDGQIIIDGQAMADWDKIALAKTLAVLRQANNITMRFTVRELVSFGRFPHSKGQLQADDKQMIQRAIHYLNLETIAERYLDELSGGQRQMAFIAMVMAQDTDYILLDEPLNNLDIKHSRQMMTVIQRLAKEVNKAVIVVIHDINFAANYSDRILALKEGKIVADGQAREVIRADTLEAIYDTPFQVIEHSGKQICLW